MFDQLHSALRGYLDPSALPKALRDVFRAIQRKRARQGNRSVRRRDQLRAENGVVFS